MLNDELETKAKNMNLGLELFQLTAFCIPPQVSFSVLVNVTDGLLM